MKKFWQDFKKFISRGNVVDMAVGVAVAGAFTAIVNAFNKGFITPLIVLLTGNNDLSSMKWILRDAVYEADGVTVKVAEVAIMYGTLIQAIIDFLIIALTLFIVMRAYAQFSQKAKALSDSVKDILTKEDEEAALRAAEEARLAEQKAAEEARIAEEKAALEKAALEKKEAEKARILSSVELLEEIRDLLKNKE